VIAPESCASLSSRGGCAVWNSLAGRASGSGARLILGEGEAASTDLNLVAGFGRALARANVLAFNGLGAGGVGGWTGGGWTRDTTTASGSGIACGHGMEWTSASNIKRCAPTATVAAK
jgi:hypothetical protein